jgi:hypothetical protein
MAEVIGMFRSLNAEQKAAAIGAVLLAISTFGPFSFVEAAEILVALGVLALLRARALRRRFHLPFGDGTVIAVAGIWAAALIVVRLLDRPPGQNLLALGCAAILVAAGARERAKRPPDDIPPDRRTQPVARADPATARTQPMAPSPTASPRPRDAHPETEPLPPPEFEPYRPEPNEQLRLRGEGARRDDVEPPDEA